MTSPQGSPARPSAAVDAAPAAASPCAAATTPAPPPPAAVPRGDDTPAQQPSATTTTDPAAQDRAHERSLDIVRELGQTRTVLIGRGTYGQVRRGYSKILGTEVVVKMCKRSPGVQQEAFLMKQLSEVARHPNACFAYDAAMDPDYVFLVMEVCPGTDFCVHLDKHPAFSEEAGVHLVEQLLSACMFLVHHGVVHRDIKIDNIIYDHATATLKLCDFGFATYWRQGEMLYDHPGTMAYSPPEVLKGRPYDGELRDVWSVGVVAYVLLFRATPFGLKSRTATRRAICNDDLPLRVLELSPPARDFIANCLDKSPLGRSRFAQLLQHPWIRRMDSVPTERPVDDEL